MTRPLVCRADTCTPPGSLRPPGAPSHTEGPHVACPPCASRCWGDSSNKTGTSCSHSRLTGESGSSSGGGCALSMAIPHASPRGTEGRIQTASELSGFLTLSPVTVTNHKVDFSPLGCICCLPPTVLTGEGMRTSGSPEASQEEAVVTCQRLPSLMPFEVSGWGGTDPSKASFIEPETTALKCGDERGPAHPAEGSSWGRCGRNRGLHSCWDHLPATAQPHGPAPGPRVLHQRVSE